MSEEIIEHHRVQFDLTEKADLFQIKTFPDQSGEAVRNLIKEFLRGTRAPAPVALVEGNAAMVAIAVWYLTSTDKYRTVAVLDRASSTCVVVGGTENANRGIGRPIRVKKTGILGSVTGG